MARTLKDGTEPDGLLRLENSKVEDSEDRTIDPAIAMAERLLSEVRGIIRQAVTSATPILIVVHTPSAAWTSPLQEAWRHIEHVPTSSARDRRSRRREKDRWSLFTCNESEKQVKNEILLNEVAACTWRGICTACFTPSPDRFLPKEILLGADRTIVIKLPSPEDVTTVSKRLFGRGRTKLRLTVVEAAAVTPVLLRFAHRAKQGGDAWIARLRTLLGQRHALATPGDNTVRGSPTLHRLHGMQAAVSWGEALATDLARYAEGSLPWSLVGGHACLLSGPPGCGKTLFARALAATCGIELVTGSYAEWLGQHEGHQGTMLRAMRETFARARRTKPCILFLDEVDSFPTRGASAYRNAEWDRQVVNALLAEIDGAAGREGVVLIAACNHPDKLDPALVRSGRLDRHVRVSLPGQADLERILREHLGEDLVDVPIGSHALVAIGSSGADCERYVRGARARARQAGRPLAPSDLMEEIGGHDTRSDAGRQRIAVHEAGHAIAAIELLPGTLQAITIRSAGNSLGATLTSGSDGVLLADDIHRRLAMLLAGRAAEQEIFGVPSTVSGGGDDSDLAMATRYAAMASASFGLGADDDLLWSGCPEPADVQTLLARDTDLTTRVRASLDDAYEIASAIVRRRRTAILAIKDALLERQALPGNDVAEIASRHPGLVEAMP